MYFSKKQWLTIFIVIMGIAISLGAGFGVLHFLKNSSPHNIPAGWQTYQNKSIHLELRHPPYLIPSNVEKELVFFDTKPVQYSDKNTVPVSFRFWSGDYAKTLDWWISLRKDYFKVINNEVKIEMITLDNKREGKSITGILKDEVAEWGGKKYTFVFIPHAKGTMEIGYSEEYPANAENAKLMILSVKEISLQ